MTPVIPQLSANGWFDHLGEDPLLGGERLRLRWPDGTTTVEVVRLVTERYTCGKPESPISRVNVCAVVGVGPHTRNLRALSLDGLVAERVVGLVALTAPPVLAPEPVVVVAAPVAAAPKLARPRKSRVVAAKPVSAEPDLFAPRATR